MAGLALLAPLSIRAQAQSVTELQWQDLLPENQAALEMLQGIIQHDQAPLLSQQPQSSGVRHDWNGQTIRLPGYIVPLDFDGTGVTAFILVPYVGACIHVPPPPANQLVFVTTETPFQSSGLFEAVRVTGTFGVSGLATDLAEIGYQIDANHIESLEG